MLLLCQSCSAVSCLGASASVWLWQSVLGVIRGFLDWSSSRRGWLPWKASGSVSLSPCRNTLGALTFQARAASVSCCREMSVLLHMRMCGFADGEGATVRCKSWLFLKAYGQADGKLVLGITINKLISFGSSFWKQILLHIFINILFLRGIIYDWNTNAQMFLDLSL